MRGIDTRIGAAIAVAALVLAGGAGAEDAKSRAAQAGAAQLEKTPPPEASGAAAGKVERPTVDGKGAPGRAPVDPRVDQKRAPDGMRWVAMPDGSLRAVPEQSGSNVAAMGNSGISLECLCRVSKKDHCTFTVDAGGDIAKCGGDGTGCKGGDGDYCRWVPGPSPRYGGEPGRVAQ